jgi:ribosomal subunit interface protein
MELPLQITYRHMESSEALTISVHEHLRKLDLFHDRILSCRVVIEAPHKHHHKGRLYHVSIEMKLPDGKLVASRAPERNHAHEDAYVAIRDAFDAMRRQLESHTKRHGA